MVTGIETAGLVLATLPLFIEAAKSYGKGVDTIRDVASSKRRDDRLQDFYDDFWWELRIFDQQVRTLVRGLPYLCDECKAALERDMSSQAPEGWEENVEVARALHHYFGSSSDYDSFILILSRILKLLARLVGEKTVHLSGVETDDQMFARLKQFGSDRDTRNTSSSLLERFKFRKKEKDREICIRNLRTWNRRLLGLTENSKNQRDQVPAVKPKDDTKASFERIQILSKKIYSALSKYWWCGCADPHEAKLGLENWDPSRTQPIAEDLKMEFLISTGGCSSNSSRWQEVSVILQGNMTKSDQQRGPCLVKICDAITQAPLSRVNIMVEHKLTEDKLWQLRSEPARLRISDTSTIRTLQDLLPSQFRIGLKNKRKLALIFAYALLRLHGGSWLRKWSKDQISFLNSASNVLNYDHPYLSAHFLRSTPAPEPIDVNVFHRNPNLLSLGILLIEVDTLKPISNHRNQIENSVPNANTDMLVAERVVKTMDGCSPNYRNAIEACLDTKWVTQSEVSLEDKTTLAGYYDRVVLPLENEWRYLSGTA